MPRVALPAGEWLPDLPGPQQGMALAQNVIPVANGYAPFQGLELLPGGTLAAYPIGADAFRGDDGLTTIIAGTSNQLYRYAGGGFENISGTLAFSANEDFGWSFTQFGQRVLCANGLDQVAYYDLSAEGPAQLLPNAPRARLLTVVANEFIVAGIISGDVMQIQWSGANNSEEWRPGFGQSDFQKLPVGGAITGLTGGEYGLILQEERICRLRYVGGNVIFQIDPLTNEVGCVHLRSVAQLGRLTFFLSPRGFMVCDGSTVTPIGDEKVDRTFLDAVVPGWQGRMSAAVDPVRKLVMWTLPEENPDEWYVYSWTLQRWSKVVLPARLIFRNRQRDFTIGEDFDQGADLLLGTGLPMGSPVFRGGAPYMGVFDDQNRLGTLTGDNLAATFAFPPQTLGGSRGARIQRVRPITDATSGLTVTMGRGARWGDVQTTVVSTDLRASGEMPLRCAARHVSPTLTIAAGTDWSFMQGLEIDFEPGAGR